MGMQLYGAWGTTGPWNKHHVIRQTRPQECSYCCTDHFRSSFQNSGCSNMLTCTEGCGWSNERKRYIWCFISLNKKWTTFILISIFTIKHWSMYLPPLVRASINPLTMAVLLAVPNSSREYLKKKWLTFSRQHFEMHFLEWKCMNFDKDFTEVCSWGSN